MTQVTTIQADHVLDCKGLGCPMPVVRTKKAIDQMEEGQVLRVEATDRGSLADLKAWATRAGHQFLGSIEENGVFKHYIRKAKATEAREPSGHPRVIQNEELEQKLDDPNIQIIDVREPAEFAFGHIPGAQSIPLGELEERIEEIDPGKEVYVVCQTGNRSDLACQILSDKGLKNVSNVTPGMSGWKGRIRQVNE